MQWAARAALAGEVAAIVTAPLHKEALAAAGFTYPGHTELLQHEAALHRSVDIAAMPVRMMLANDELRTVLVSIHVPLREAIESLSTEGVLQTLRITHDALMPLLGQAPRMAVAGLNPHAGEGGLFGREELDIIAVLLAWDAETATGLPPLTNDEVADVVKKYPRQFVGFACVDPWKGSRAVEDMERAITELGLIGAKFHPGIQAFYPNDKQFYPLYEKITALGVPALFHTGTNGLGAGTPGGVARSFGASSDAPASASASPAGSSLAALRTNVLSPRTSARPTKAALLTNERTNLSRPPEAIPRFKTAEFPKASSESGVPLALRS